MNKILSHIKKHSIFYASLLFAILLDQISKFVVQTNMQLYESRRVLDGFFRLTYIKNKGIAFGLFQSSFIPGQKMILGIFSIVALAFLIYLYIKSKKIWVEQLSIGLILGGAIGNLFDRFFLKSVTDFCDFGIGKYRWFTFNLADASIVVGVILLFFVVYMEEKQQKNKEK